jgi:hypothetical protein
MTLLCTVPFTTFTTRKWAVLTRKIDKLFIGIGIKLTDFLFFLINHLHLLCNMRHILISAINPYRKQQVINDTEQSNTYIYYAVTFLTWITVGLMIFSVAMGEQILQYVVALYPNFSLPAFFVPWFLLVLTSVQKLQKKTVKLSLQLWILRTTIPIFIFILPFFSAFLTSSGGLLNTKNLLISDNNMLLGFEPYCLYIAIIVLFVVHFLPVFVDKK